MTRLPLRGAIALGLFALLVALRVADYYPRLPNPLVVDLLLAPGPAGRSDPVLTSGRPLTGDFLSVRFIDAATVQFVYDHWGSPGLTSAPVILPPDGKLRLTLTLPALDQIQGNLGPASNRIRIESNGTQVLDTTGPFSVREPARIFFAENPLGGTACGPSLHGRLLAANGRELRGGPDAVFSRGDALLDWFTSFPHQVVVLLLVAGALAFYGDRLFAPQSALRRGLHLAARHRWFTGSALAATLVYAWLVTYGNFRFGAGDIFGSFYDYQAASLLQGRLDVPEDAIGGEAFEFRGKLYGYFGPTPALLRLPFIVSGFAFGQLSRGFMVAYFLASLVAAYLLFQHARGKMRGLQAGSFPPPGPWAVCVLVGSVGLGSTLFFVGSRSFMYHEAILGGITFALWSGWCTLRHLDAPERRWWLGALLCGIASVHTRPPTGLFALTCLGSAVCMLAFRDWRAGRWHLPRLPGRALGIAFLCAAGFLSLNGLAWLKFRSFDAAPLKISRPYQNPERLAKIDGRSFHLANVPHNFDAYFVRTNFHREREFPWIYFGSRTPLREYPRARIDLPDHTIAIPYAMPSLFVLATLGSLGAALAFPATRSALATLWLAVLPMALALFAAVAIAQRYTGDFCPFLIATAAFGLAAGETLAATWRWIIRTLLAGLTVAAIALTVPLTLHYQGEMLWGMPDELRRDYQKLRHRIDYALGVNPNPPPAGTPPAR